MKKFSLFWMLGLFSMSATAADPQTFYYDVNGMCPSWCTENPGNACCSGDNIVNSLANKVSKSGYSLRGFSGSSVLEVSSNAGVLSNLVVDKSGETVGSITDETSLYAAWAQNCATNITGGTCSLTVDQQGNVSYVATPNTGYFCSTGCQTANPVFQAGTPGTIPEDWIVFSLNSNGGSGGNPATFACQRNANATSGCSQGCYKSIDSCDNSNKFTGLDSQPSKTNFKYDGYFWNAIEILDDTGQLNGQTWTNVSGAGATVVARWTEQKIDLIYNKGNCQGVPSASSSNPKKCTVGGTFTLQDDAIPNTNQEFDGWAVNGHINATLNCTREDLGGDVGESVTITAQCSDKTPEQNTVNLSYVASCAGQANCPIVSGLPTTCKSGDPLNLTHVSGNSSWEFNQFCMGAVCETSFTCPDSDETIVAEFTAVSSDETTITINYNKGNCTANIPPDAQHTCTVGEQLYLNLNPDPDGIDNYPYRFSGWLVNNNLINANYSNATGYVNCDRATLGGNSGESVTITARCVNFGMAYDRACYGRYSDCPQIVSGTADYPNGCVIGESITIPQWTGSLPDGWSFKGWKFRESASGWSDLYHPGDTWRCGDAVNYDWNILVVFNVPITWKTVYLNNTVADSQSNPRWLCEDTEGKLTAYASGITYRWYDGGDGDSPVCDADTNIRNISIPQSNRWEYGGHIWDGSSSVLIDQSGAINNIILNGSSASAVWNPIVRNYVTLSYVADCGNGQNNCPALSDYSLTCIPDDTIKLEPVPGNSSWIFDTSCINGTCGTSFTCPSQNANIAAKFKQNTETNININYEAGNCAPTVTSGTVPSCTVGETFELQLNNATNHIGWKVNNRLINQWDLLCDRSVLGGEPGSTVTMTAQCKGNDTVYINYKSDCDGYAECPSFGVGAYEFPTYYPGDCNPGEIITVPMSGWSKGVGASSIPNNSPLPNGWVFMGWKVYNGAYDFVGIPYAPGQSFACPQKTDSNNGIIHIKRMYYIPE